MLDSVPCKVSCSDVLQSGNSNFSSTNPPKILPERNKVYNRPFSLTLCIALKPPLSLTPSLHSFPRSKCPWPTAQAQGSLIFSMGLQDISQPGSTPCHRVQHLASTRNADKWGRASCLSSPESLSGPPRITAYLWIWKGLLQASISGKKKTKQKNPRQEQIAAITKKEVTNKTLPLELPPCKILFHHGLDLHLHWKNNFFEGKG